ncbi:hypothetical protein ISE1_1818 [plant metagenome]|uniref:Uncharacterized protein n=1 Tax=plant metagenome TaxID=1297885 RepID=A0A484SP46_9ZZZZ
MRLCQRAGESAASAKQAQCRGKPGAPRDARNVMCCLGLHDSSFSVLSRLCWHRLPKPFLNMNENNSHIRIAPKCLSNTSCRYFDVLCIS